MLIRYPPQSIKKTNIKNTKAIKNGLKYKKDFSQQSIARKNSSDGKIEYIMASMLIVLLDVW